MKLDFKCLQKICSPNDLFNDWYHHWRSTGLCYFYDPINYISNPFGILTSNKGGMSYHGGAVGAMLAVIFYAFVIKNQPFYCWLLGLFSTIGIGLGRLANFINGELYG